MQITRRYEWDMGHRLQGHEGLCRNLHGHRYAAEVTVEGPIVTSGPSRGMVLDFNVLDVILRRILAPWDHALVLEAGDPVEVLLRESAPSLRMEAWDCPPTAENIAAHVAALVRAEVPRGVTVVRVLIQETPRSRAEWVA